MCRNGSSVRPHRCTAPRIPRVVIFIDQPCLVRAKPSATSPKSRNCMPILKMSGREIGGTKREDTISVPTSELLLCNSHKIRFRSSASDRSSAGESLISVCGRPLSYDLNAFKKGHEDFLCLRHNYRRVEIVYRMCPKRRRNTPNFQTRFGLSRTNARILRSFRH